MKHFITIWLILAALCSSAQKKNTFVYHHYTGTIGKNIEATADLCFQDDSNVTGYYSYDLDRIPYPVFGTMTGKNQFELSNDDWKDGGFTKIEAAINADGSIKGKLTNSRKGTKEDVLLKETYPAGSIKFNGMRYTASRKFINDPASPECTVEYSLLVPFAEKKEIKDSVWSDILLRYFEKTSGADASAVMKETADEILNNYQLQEYDTTNISSSYYELLWSVDKSMKVVCNSDELLSLEFSAYQFAGGAHGMYGSVFSSIDMKTGKQIRLYEVIDTLQKSKIAKILTQKVRYNYDIKASDSLSDANFFTESIVPGNNFYLTKKGIGFFYNPYEVACYALGTVNVFVPFNEIKEFMKKDFMIKYGIFE
jgi:hypothetical protein